MTNPQPKLSHWIEQLSKYLSVTFIIAVAVTVYDIILDVVFKEPTVWVYDVVTTLIAVAFLIGGSYALQRREHIRITAVYDLFSARYKLWCDIFTSLLSVIYLLAFAWFAFKMASLSVMNWEVGGSVWRQPTPVIVKVSMFIGAALMILQAVVNTIADIKALKQLGSS